jgi:hypothetical protein
MSSFGFNLPCLALSFSPELFESYLLPAIRTIHTLYTTSSSTHNNKASDPFSQQLSLGSQSTQQSQSSLGHTGGSNAMAALVVALPRVVVGLESDVHREAVLMVIAEALAKAMKDKDFLIINAVLKEIPILYEEYSHAPVKVQYTSSLQILGQVKKQLVGVSGAADKDWRNYEQYLLFVKHIHRHSDKQHFCKNYLQNLLRNLKK